MVLGFGGMPLWDDGTTTPDQSKGIIPQLEPTRTLPSVFDIARRLGCNVYSVDMDSICMTRRSLCTI